MKLESTEFTEADIDGFVSDYFDLERELLIGRLQAIIEKTEALVPDIEASGETPGDAWNARETLAHMATTVQFMAGLAHEISTKKKHRRLVK